MHALVAEVMKKVAIVWLGTLATPVWCLGIDDSLYVVAGGDEQPAPGLTPRSTIEVSARGDHNGKIVTWLAAVTRVMPGGADWAEVTPQLAAKRLNASGTSEALIERWAAECELYRLLPLGDDATVGGRADETSGAAEPRPTPASRRTATPYHLHKVKRR
jgi:hypothetical protein